VSEKEETPGWLHRKEQLEAKIEAAFPGALANAGKQGVLGLVAKLLELEEDAAQTQETKADEPEVAPEVPKTESAEEPTDGEQEQPPPEYTPSETAGVQEWAFDWSYSAKVLFSTLVLFLVWAWLPGVIHSLNYHYLTETWHFADLWKGDLAIFGRPTEVGLALAYWCNQAHEVQGWVFVTVCWFLWVMYLRPYRYRRVGFPDIGAEIKRIAAVHALDENLLSHLMLKTMLASKTKFHADNVRYAALQWIRLNRKTWTEVQILEQVTRSVGVCMEATPCETALFSYWEADGVLDSMRVVTRWVKEGLLPAGGRMELA
jgi:hypothetical protein